MNEIATEAGVHPTVITKWKRQLLEGLPQIFANNHKHKDGETEKLVANLYQKIGQLEVELDWLKKNLSSPVAERRELIEVEHPQISIVRQCGLLGISRSGYYYYRQATEDSCF